jgi:polar amino acid transport system permease protein
MQEFIYVTQSLLEGFGVTCLLFILTLVFSLPLGLGISFLTMSKIKPIKYIFKFIVWIVRGVPLMLQLFIVFYLPGMLSETGLNPFGQLDNFLFFKYGIDNGGRFIATLIAFSLNYACYFSEIFRGGIESIPKGQTEAGKVLGMTKGQIFFKVILMQVVKRIIPPMSNEIITLVKDTSLARIIAVSEILMAAERFSGRGLIWPLFYTGVYFLLFNGVLTVLFNKIEKKLDYYKV